MRRKSAKRGKVKIRARSRREARDFHPLAGMLPADLKKRGIYAQVYAYAGQVIVWAGPHYVPEITAQAAFKLEQHWRRWRHWYDNLPANRKRSYPAKEGPRAADCLVVFPVDNPKSQKVYYLGAAK